MANLIDDKSFFRVNGMHQHGKHWVSFSMLCRFFINLGENMLVQGSKPVLVGSMFSGSTSYGCPISVRVVSAKYVHELEGRKFLTTDDSNNYSIVLGRPGFGKFAGWVTSSQAFEIS